jgi:hypothetical protein
MISYKKALLLISVAENRNLLTTLDGSVNSFQQDRHTAFYGIHKHVL